MLLNAEVKDLAITAINVTTHQFATRICYPAAVVLINGIKCRALLGSDAGSSYFSLSIANLLRKPPVRKETKWIEMMMNSITRNIEIYIKQLLNTYGETLQWK